MHPFFVETLGISGGRGALRVTKQDHERIAAGLGANMRSQMEVGPEKISYADGLETARAREIQNFDHFPRKPNFNRIYSLTESDRLLIRLKFVGPETVATTTCSQKPLGVVVPPGGMPRRWGRRAQIQRGRPML